MDYKIGYPIHLSERVEELLREGTLDEILSIIQNDIDKEWKSTPPGDSQARELLYHESHALNRLNLKLAIIIESLAMSRRGD